jgi:hypothetical protein
MDAKIERIVKRNPSFLTSKLRMPFSRVKKHIGKVVFDAPESEEDEDEETSGDEPSKVEEPDARIEVPRDESPIDNGTPIPSSPILSKDKGKAR